jgi:hypothetical protein
MEDWIVEKIATEPALQGKRFIFASHATVYPPSGAPTEYDPTAGSPMRVGGATAAAVKRLEQPVSNGGAGANIVAVVGGHYRPKVDVDLAILVAFAWDLEPGGSYVRVFANGQTLGDRGAGWGVILEVDEQTGEICIWDEDMVVDEAVLKYGGSRLCATPN